MRRLTSRIARRTAARARLALGVVAAVIASSSWAQVPSTISAERLRPATTSAGVIDVESAAVAPHLSWSATWWGAYALDPLVVSRGDERLGAFVGHRLGSDLIFSVGLFEWLELAADLPVVVFQASDPKGLGDAAPALSAVGLSDLRLASKFRLLRASEQLVDLALITALTAPTGFPAGESFLGDGQFVLLPEVAMSRRFDDGVLAGLVVAGNALARVRPAERTILDVTFGHELVGRVGLGYRLHERLSVPVRLDVSGSWWAPLLTPFASPGLQGVEIMTAMTADVLRLPMAVGAGDGLVLQAFVGGAVGLGGGPGTPTGRGFIGLRAEKPADPDLDDDFVADAMDACPSEAEDKDGFADHDGCVDVDNDSDGIVDSVDGCENEPEDHDGFEDTDGCAELDNDLDLLLDTVDACADLPGPPDNRGCPWLDGDGDGVIDRDDRCPTLAGASDQGGCPTSEGAAP